MKEDSLLGLATTWVVQLVKREIISMFSYTQIAT